MKTRERILAELEGENMTATQLGLAIRICTVRNIKSVLERLHRDRLVYIVDWKTHTVPVWRAGAGTDRKRPPKTTDADRSRRYRCNHKALVRARQAQRQGYHAGHFIQLMRQP